MVDEERERRVRVVHGERETWTFGKRTENEMNSAYSSGFRRRMRKDVQFRRCSSDAAAVTQQCSQKRFVIEGQAIKQQCTRRASEPCACIRVSRTIDARASERERMRSTRRCFKRFSSSAAALSKAMCIEWASNQPFEFSRTIDTWATEHGCNSEQPPLTPKRHCGSSEADVDSYSTRTRWARERRAR